MSIEAFDLTDANEDWHDVFSVKLGELFDEGFEPFGDARWTGLDWYSEEQRKRVEDKFLARYRYRELGITPPLVWRDMLTSRMMEVLPKYRLLYEAQASGIPLLADQDEYGKRRDVFSDFPATQIAPDNQDYASNATDNQWEHVTIGDWLDKVRQVRTYRDIDMCILDDMEVMFSCLATVATPW